MILKYSTQLWSILPVVLLSFLTHRSGEQYIGLSHFWLLSPQYFIIVRLYPYLLHMWDYFGDYYSYSSFLKEFQVIFSIHFNPFFKFLQMEFIWLDFLLFFSKAIEHMFSYYLQTFSVLHIIKQKKACWEINNMLVIIHLLHLNL